MIGVGMADSTNPSGYGKLGAAVAASWLASYAMTQMSLHGVNFTEFGVDSEIVKSTIIGGLVGFFTFLTPRNFVESITNTILFCKEAITEWKNAINKPEGN